MNYNHFTKDERNELAILLKKGYFQKDIAETLDNELNLGIGKETLLVKSELIQKRLLGCQRECPVLF